MKILKVIIIALVCNLSLVIAEPKNLTYEQVAKNWQTYIDNLNKRLQAKGMLPYEERLNMALLERMRPVNAILQKYKKGKNEDQKQILEVTRNSAEVIAILEKEIKRAENIRLLFVKVQKAGKKDMYNQLNELQIKSIKIREAELQIVELSKSYVNTYKTINEKSQLALDLKAIKGTTK
jgi:hypothetical protein